MTRKPIIVLFVVAAALLGETQSATRNQRIHIHGARSTSAAMTA